MLRGLTALAGWLMIGGGVAAVNVPAAFVVNGSLLLGVALLPVVLHNRKP